MLDLNGILVSVKSISPHRGASSMKSQSKRGSSRRDFLVQTSGVATLGAATSIARAAARANERIGIGLIGVGGRGSDHRDELIRLASSQNVQITAVCDVWRKASQAAAHKVAEKLGHEPRQFTRFGDLLDQREVDAVVIATPDFSHGTILKAALKAAKDVYVEKPMTIDLASAREALDLARAEGRVVQTGTQRRSDGHFRAAGRCIATGELGQISRVSAAVSFNEPRWKRPVADLVEADVDWPAYLLHLPDRPFDAKLLRCWQLYRETSNGLPGLWMTHFADAVHMLTGATFADSAVAMGGIYVWKDGRQHTDTFHALLEYPQGFLFDWGMGLGNASGGHFTVHGTRGTLDAVRWTIQPESKNGKSRPIPPEPAVSHMENWLECLRSRRRPNADIEFGYQHVVATVMAAERSRQDTANRTTRKNASFSRVEPGAEFGNSPPSFNDAHAHALDSPPIPGPVYRKLHRRLRGLADGDQCRHEHQHCQYPDLPHRLPDGGTVQVLRGTERAAVRAAIGTGEDHGRQRNGRLGPERTHTALELRDAGNS